MATFDTSVVLQAYDGQLWAGPAGTTVPTDTTTALDAGYVSQGWLTEDGLTFNPNLDAPDAIKGWPRGETLLQPAATLSPEFGFTLAQHDSDALDWITDPSREMSIVLEYKATAAGDVHRLVLPKVKVTEAGEMAFNTEDLVGVEITVGAQADDTAGYTFAFLLPGGESKSY
jgi:hypothetical protein